MLCYSGKEPLEVILEEQKKTFELVQKRNTSDFVSIRQVVMNAMDKIEQAAKKQRFCNGNTDRLY